MFDIVVEILQLLGTVVELVESLCCEWEEPVVEAHDVAGTAMIVAQGVLDERNASIAVAVQLVKYAPVAVAPSIDALLYVTNNHAETS